MSWIDYLPKHINTYKDAEALYESIKVLRGKRHDKSEDIRPIGKRFYWYDRIVKGNRSYSICSWGWDGKPTPCKLITWKKDQVIVHVPRQYSNKPSPGAANQPHLNTLYWVCLPDGLTITNHRAKPYIKCEGKFYYLGRDLRFKRVGERWEIQNPVQEYNLTLDRERTKEIRKLMAPFLSYTRVMLNIEVTHRAWVSQAPYRRGPWKTYLIRKSLWYPLAEHYIKRGLEYRAIWDGNRWTSSYNKPDIKTIERTMYRDLIKKERPFKRTVVPIGELCYSSYEHMNAAKGVL